jgi:phage baseplate assembly protein W
MSDNFKGIIYPITDHARGFFHSSADGIEQIKSDLLILLLSNFNERVMLPDFGANLRQYTFEPNDLVLQQQIKNAISVAITKWEPRVVVQSIDITTGSNIDRHDLNVDDTRNEVDNLILIKITFFDPENIQDVQELRLEI